MGDENIEEVIQDQWVVSHNNNMFPDDVEEMKGSVRVDVVPLSRGADSFKNVRGAKWSAKNADDYVSGADTGIEKPS